MTGSDGHHPTHTPLGLAAARRVIDVLTAEEPPALDAEGLPTIPGYRIRRKLGEGGGGEVFLGVRDGSDRPLAIKVLDRRLGTGKNFFIGYHINFLP